MQYGSAPITHGTMGGEEHVAGMVTWHHHMWYRGWMVFREHGVRGASFRANGTSGQDGMYVE